MTSFLRLTLLAGLLFFVAPASHAAVIYEMKLFNASGATKGTKRMISLAFSYFYFLRQLWEKCLISALRALSGRGK